MSEKNDFAHGLLGLLVVIGVVVLVFTIDGEDAMAFLNMPVQDMTIFDLAIVLFWFGIFFR